MKVKKFVTETFIKLTSKTCPFGFEDKFMKDIVYDILPNGFKRDEVGNYFYNIGESKTVFASHIDTVSSVYRNVNHVINGKIISTDGTSTLGADDKAGMVIMLWMIKNKIPGLYYFFIGEESGCIGSKFASENVELFSKYDRIISFDRRGTNSVITSQYSMECCSSEFSDDLCKELNKFGMSYVKDNTGIYTDSAEFMGIIPECTNISVGYYNEHSNFEYQDIDHLINLAKACVLVDWENLSTKRDPSEFYLQEFYNELEDDIYLNYEFDDYIDLFN